MEIQTLTDKQLQEGCEALREQLDEFQSEERQRKARQSTKFLFQLTKRERDRLSTYAKKTKRHMAQCIREDYISKLEIN